MLTPSSAVPICNPLPKLLPGLEGLAATVDEETYVYILRSLYRMLFAAGARKESKAKLQRRIEQFERDSKLPGFLSSVPLETLIAQLEDAQYVYPLHSREVEFPTFH